MKMMKMKILRNLSIIAVLAIIVTTVSCGKDDDPKQQETEDLESPVVAITAPVNGSTFKSLDALATVTIKYNATDDVELASVVIDFDGTQVEEVTTFTDFRSLSGQKDQASVGDGEHTISITVTDKSGKSSSATSTFTKVTSVPYTALDNEVLYLAFEGNYLESISETEVTVVGTPGFAGAGAGDSDDAYAGATDAYLTYDGTALGITNTMTVSLWMKINNAPDRAGILTLSPVDDVNTDFQNKRTSGFRFFREAAGDNQVFKLNFGTGDAEVWLDGGALSQLPPNTDEWAHLAFIIDETTAVVYLNGAKAAESAEHLGLDMTGCDLLTIMSGDPRFTEWGHHSDLSYIDDLKIFNAALTEAELTAITGVQFGDPEVLDPADPGLTPIDGADATEVLYMSFDTDFSTTGTSVTATEVGSPTVVTGGKSGKAYSGGVDSYVTIPTAGLLGTEFSASMWIKMNSTADRAGILTIGAPDLVNTATPNNRNFGFRLFREGNALAQTFKLNVGNGTADQWIDGGAFATFSANREGWLHMAITIGRGKTQVYLNGVLAAVSAEDIVVDWTDCDILSIGSGAPRFVEWGHLGETGMIDELKLYSGILNPAQIAALKAQ